MFTHDTEKLKNRAKYLSNSISVEPNKNVVPTIFKRYYSWLTDSMNFYNATIGQVVKMFSIFGETNLDPHISSSKGVYAQFMERIAYGIIKSCTNAESLSLFDYINYQIKAMEILFKTKGDLEDENMVHIYKELFFIQDLDKDGRLGVQDLAVSLAYLDMQDGVLNGKFRYEDAITFGQDINSEVGKFKMKLELNNLKELLYT